MYLPSSTNGTINFQIKISKSLLTFVKIINTLKSSSLMFVLQNTCDVNLKMQNRMFYGMFSRTSLALLRIMARLTSLVKKKDHSQHF